MSGYQQPCSHGIQSRSLQPRFLVGLYLAKAWQAPRAHKRLNLLTLEGQFTRDPRLVCARTHTQLEGLHYIRDWHNVRGGGGDAAIVWYGVKLLWIMPPTTVNNN